MTTVILSVHILSMVLTCYADGISCQPTCVLITRFLYLYKSHQIGRSIRLVYHTDQTGRHRVLSQVFFLLYQYHSLVVFYSTKGKKGGWSVVTYKPHSNRKLNAVIRYRYRIVNALSVIPS